MPSHIPGNRNLKLVFLGTLGILLSSCSPMVRPEQPARADFATITSGKVLTQTFTARYRGLAGIEVYVRPNQQPAGSLVLQLHSNPAGEQGIAKAPLPQAGITNPGYYRFSFPPQPDSFNRDYSFSLELEGEGALEVGAAPGGAYLHGALYQDGEPDDLQVTFNLIYDPSQAILGLAGLALTWMAYLAAGLFLFVLPGWAVLSLLWPAWKPLDWAAKLALSAGISLALYPILFLWTDLIGLRLGALYAWLPPLAGLVALAARGLLVAPRPLRFAIRLPRIGVADLAFLAVMALVFAVRAWVIRGLDAPLWGDSYQHTVITQLLVDNGGLFRSWSPYAELYTFTYHFGFHSLAAAFHWITRLPVTQAILWTGQLVNTLAVLALYPLATRLGGSRWAGIIALLVAGLLAPMPMFYVNWGRYTQLAGQAILPVAIYFFWMALKSERLDWGLVIPAWIAMGGLALTHYRVLMFAAIFVPALVLVYAWNLRPRALFINAVALAVGAGLLFTPWFLRVYSGKILGLLTGPLSTPAQAVSDWTQQYNAIGDLFTYLPAWMWLLLPVMTGWGLWLKNRGVAVVGLWWFLIIVLANPSWLGLPGEGILSNFAVFIAAYIPAALILAAGISNLAGLFVDRARSRGAPAPAVLAGMGLLILAAMLWGARQRLGDLRLAESTYYTRADQRAFTWIGQNVPAEARFLVNSFPAYGNTLIVGSDGGWWLPLLAGRQTTLPPLNYGTELGPTPDNRQWVNGLTNEILEKGISDAGVLAMLSERGVSHVYIGQRQGRVNNLGPVIEPVDLLADQHFEPVYHQDRVWIFRLARP